MILRADEEPAVETEGGGDGDLPVSESHLLSGTLEFHQEQVLCRVSQAELVGGRHFDHIGWGVDGELESAESVVSAVHSEYY